MLSGRSGVAFGQQCQDLGRCTRLKEKENVNKLGHAMYLFIYQRVFDHLLKVAAFLSLASIANKSFFPGQF